MTSRLKIPLETDVPRLVSFLRSRLRNWEANSAIREDCLFVIETGDLQDIGTYFGLDAGVLQVASDVGDTPLPAALPLFATGLGAMGLLGWRRKRKAQAAA